MRSLLVLLLAAGPAGVQDPPAPAPVADALLTIGEALRGALARNPELADRSDALAVARSLERGVHASYFPQITPFFSTERGDETEGRRDAYGVLVTEQFPWGARLEGRAAVDRTPELADAPYGSSYDLTFRQPLAAGADPAVASEPLRLARRATAGETRAYESARRRTVIAVYRTYLGIARQEEAVRIAEDRIARARDLTAFSRARFTAGGVSRVDVLRAEQQEAAAAVARNDAANLLEDLKDSLRRIAQLPTELPFRISPPECLPQTEADLARAVEGVAERRPEAIEARDRVLDAEFALRIAKSLELPFLDGIVGYQGGGTGRSVGDALRARDSAWTFGLASQYGLNSAAQRARRRVAEIELAARERNFRLLEEDLARDVRFAYRRLESQRRNYAVAVENRSVADLQLEVSQLRFEKGLSDNFDVIDAENLLTSARLLELDSRFQTLLARLDCLFASGFLDVSAFLGVP